MTEPPQPAGSVPVALGAHTELRRAEAFELRFKGGSATAWVTGRRTPLPPFGLALLDAFGVPRPAAEGLDRAAGGGLGVGDWARLHGALAVLVGAGVLVRSDAALGDVQGARDPYDDPAVHLAMLQDGVRTGAFLTAVEGIVRPGDVVLEVGTGTGILAVAAAKAGARRVYAVEASGVAEVARGVFEANGVADRITLLRDRSTAVELPERADVLITETLGDDPLGEGIVDIVRDARRRLLVPLPRLIPRRLDLFAAPVELAAEDRRELLGTPEVWNDLGSRYGLDLGPLASSFGGRRRLLVAPQRARRWRRLADPVRLAAVDLATALPVVEASAELQIESPGRLDGVLLWGELDLGDGVGLSQDPAAEAGPGHWRTAV
ncbi:MAG: 50S ribosomal protein L11 methyltransferase, partial [Acidobacteriota bacterium]